MPSSTAGPSNSAGGFWGAEPLAPGSAEAEHYLWSRVAGFGLAAAVVALVPAVGPRRFLLAMVILAAIPLVIVGERFGSRLESRHRFAGPVVIDLTICALGAAIIPTIWPAVFMIGSMILVGYMPRIEPVVFRICLVFYLVAMVTTALAYEVVDWLIPVAAACVVGGMMSREAYQIRSMERQTLRRVRAIVSSSAAVAWERDREDGPLKTILGPIENLVGYSAQEWLEIFPGEVVIEDDQRPTFLPDGSVERMFCVRHRDGRPVWVKEVTAPAWDDEAGWVRGTWVDITAAIEARDHYQARIDRDPLTGMASRHRFETDLRDLLAGGQPTTLILVRVKGLEALGEARGRGARERAVSHVAARLRSVMGANVLLGRVGDGDFAIAVAESETANVVRLVNGLRTRLAGPLRIDRAKVNLHCLIGVSTSNPKASRSERTLFRLAEVALTTVTPPPTGPPTTSIAPSDEELANLSDDLERRLELWLQPIVEIATEEVTGFEALARWHSGGRVALPDTFLDVVKTFGLIERVDRHAITQAASHAKLLHSFDDRLTASVNLSRNGLFDRNLLARLRKQLSAPGADPSLLIVEVSEWDLRNDSGYGIEMLHELRSIGVGVSLDDFGTGMVPFVHLLGMPLTQLKIDRSQVMGMTTDRKRQAFVRAAIEIAHDLGVEAVAEGVADRETADLLGEFGCDLGQGFLYGKARPVVEVLMSLDGRTVDLRSQAT